MACVELGECTVWLYLILFPKRTKDGFKPKIDIANKCFHPIGRQIPFVRAQFERLWKYASHHFGSWIALNALGVAVSRHMIGVWYVGTAQLFGRFSHSQSTILKAIAHAISFDEGLQVSDMPAPGYSFFGSRALHDKRCCGLVISEKLNRNTSLPIAPGSEHMARRSDAKTR